MECPIEHYISLAVWVWYGILFIHEKYTDEYETRLNVNVPNNYKSMHIKT